MTLFGTLKLIGILVLACLSIVLVWARLKMWVLHRHDKGRAVPRFLRSLLVGPTVTIREGVLVHDTGKVLETIDIKNLKQIEYHYHAVAGFVSTWEFIDKDGRLINIDGKTRGLQVVLKQLERSLPGFRLESWQYEFDRGDVEDSFVVWSAV